ncbi:Vesicular inhibitory amino acid transporter, putative [Perkinsus marinus ATCC 50983]|uniref:Vesicular inhibitory amino acid transporter, putative n=1 Tax=Perkinsus marinus (strain ATCC 50983 / TXsc) TaxID=423536 RepID=C5KUY9_PERM5|nr:Vesicular inhibitory amino acid transporter, putative [Perkinsus marinus ATCC 50983]EER11704.1 Vesicular inhibitory amino acid transporter, putative [Perkinsus marinus ATCC 50983]|eukprot:XP_002779909.1 Vesicular inhibitory amino acid transporter, putative [Perkinsus marinus ATCC 50983]
MAGKCLGYFNNNKKTTNALSDSESFTQEVTVSETSTTTITTSNTSKPNSDFKTVPEARGGKCSNLRSVFNLILTAIGIGVIMLPTTFANCGWFGGLLILFVVAVISNHMVGKIYIAYTSHPQGEAINTYEQLGYVCFGPAGAIATAGIVHITMTGCCSTLLLLLGENTQKLIPMAGLSSKVWCCIWAAICWPLTWLKSLNEVSYVSAFGMAALIVLFILIVVNGITNGITTEEENSYDWWIWNPLEFGVSFGNAMLSYHVTNVLATLIRDMKTPSALPKVATISYLCIFVIYGGIAGCGYFGYGNTLVDVPIIDRIAPPTGGLDAWGYICVISLICLCFPHYIVLLFPIAASLEYQLLPLPPFKVDDPEDAKGTIPTAKRIVVRTFLVAITLVIAIVVPSVQKLIDLLSVFTMTAMAGILPGVFYIRMRVLNEGSFMTVWKSSKVELSILFLMMALSVLMIVVGGYESIVTF